MPTPNDEEREKLVATGAEQSFVEGLQGYASFCETLMRTGSCDEWDWKAIAAKFRDAAFVIDQLEKLRDGKLAIGFRLVSAAEESDQAATISRLTAEVARKDAALEPFAAAANAYAPHEGGDRDVAWAHDFTIGSLRRARSALANTAEEGDGGGTNFPALATVAANLSRPVRAILNVSVARGECSMLPAQSKCAGRLIPSAKQIAFVKCTRPQKALVVKRNAPAPPCAPLRTRRGGREPQR